MAGWLVCGVQWWDKPGVDCHRCWVGVQQWVGPGGDRHIVGGGDQQLVRPGVEGHAAGCVMWWFTGVSQTWRGMENYWVVWVDSVYLVF